MRFGTRYRRSLARFCGSATVTVKMLKNPGMAHVAENKIDYLEYPASDLETVKRFYSSVFGWKFEDYGPEYTVFHDERLGGGFTTRVKAPLSGLVVVVYCADLEGAEGRVRRAGGEVVKQIFAFSGGRRFHIKDPSGNELAVWSE